MKKGELLAIVEHKPNTMGCCQECKGKKKDCEPNPLNCMDFCIWNMDKIKELGLINW